MRALVVTSIVATSVASIVVLAGAGCGPSDECKRYVACQKAYDATVDTTAYDDGGSCWTTLQTALACNDQCKQALDAIASTPGAPAACVSASSR